MCPKKTRDVDPVGFVKNRIVFYNTFSFQDLLIFIDDVLKYRLSLGDEKFDCLPCLPNVDVYAPPELQLVISKEEDETQCKFTVVNEECSDMKVFHVPPPTFPARALIHSIEPKTKSPVNLVCSGSTKPFQDSLVKSGFKL